MSTATRSKIADRDGYLDLVKRLPPRPIHSEDEYEAAAAVVDALAVRDEGSLSPAEEDYLLALSRFIEDYDREQYLPKRRKCDPIRSLKFLLNESGMSTADLGRLLGNSGLASQVLQGNRSLSKSNIRALADHFHVSADLFL